MKKLYFTLILLIVIFTSNTFVIHSAFAVEISDECNGMFEVRLECDLSGWMKLVLGYIAVVASLALFLHYLPHRSNLKIEQNSINIQKIITKEQETRKRRRIYVIHSLKNHFATILLHIGLMNKFPERLPHKLVEIESVLHRTRNTLNLSIDVIDPMLVGQIEQFLVVFEQNVLQNVQAEKLSDYDKLKNDIMQLTKRLDEYSGNI